MSAAIYSFYEEGYVNRIKCQQIEFSYQIIHLSSPLDFLKNYEKLFPELAVLAKKFLSVQASSASCERMFSIAGHIFQCKRRRMSHSLFCALVFLKLNESLY